MNTGSGAVPDEDGSSEGVGESDRHAGQVLHGARAIQQWLVDLGFVDTLEEQVFGCGLV
jgi:hypothetical protein